MNRLQCDHIGIHIDVEVIDVKTLDLDAQARYDGPITLEVQYSPGAITGKMFVRVEKLGVNDAATAIAEIWQRTAPFTGPIILFEIFKKLGFGKPQAVTEAQVVSATEERQMSECPNCKEVDTMASVGEGQLVCFQCGFKVNSL